MDYCLVALIGLAAGALINLLAEALPAGRMPSAPRYADGRRRPPIAWLGIAASALQRRRAPQSAAESASGDSKPASLSWRYPLVEAALSALMLLAYAVARDRYALSAAETLIWLALVALFVLIAIIDLEHRRVPLSPLLACGLLALIRVIARPQSSPPLASMLVGAAFAGFCFGFVYLGGRLFALIAARKQPNLRDMTVFGRGDVYLMTVGGLIVGFPQALIAVALTLMLGGAGAACRLAAMRVSGGYRRFRALPYAPYILASVYAIMLSRAELSRLFFGL